MTQIVRILQIHGFCFDQRGYGEGHMGEVGGVEWEHARLLEARKWLNAQRLYMEAGKARLKVYAFLANGCWLHLEMIETTRLGDDIRGGVTLRPVNAVGA